MNTQEIKSFLYIVKYGSISKAAEKLFISQSTISKRLSQLEHQVGAKLIIRGKGLKNISLTPKGEQFLTFANRYMSFIKDFEAWKKESIKYKLKVSGPASINFYSLKDFYTNLVVKPFPFILEITTHWNKIIYQLIENYSLDIGIVSRPFVSNNLITDPLFSEQMVMVSNSRVSSYNERVDAHILKTENEIKLDWGPEFDLWHDNIWNPNSHSKVIVDLPQLMLWYLNIPDSWAIVPQSVATHFKKNNNIKISEIYPRIPSRVIYKIKQKNLTFYCEKSIKIYENELEKYLNNLDSIKRL